MSEGIGSSNDYWISYRTVTGLFVGLSLHPTHHGHVISTLPVFSHTCVCVCVLHIPRGLCVSVIINHSFCSQSLSRRSLSRDEWVVQAGQCSTGVKQGWQPHWGRRRKWHYHGGGFECVPCEM